MNLLSSHKLWSSWCNNENLDEWVPQMESETSFCVSISDCLWHLFIVTNTIIFSNISEIALPVAMISAHTVMCELITTARYLYWVFINLNSTKSVIVKPLLVKRSNLLDATRKIKMNECHKWSLRNHLMCQSVIVCGILSL